MRDDKRPATGREPSAQWADEPEAPIRPLTRLEAQQLLAQQNRAVSPWRVVAVQVGMGLVMAGVGVVLLGRKDWGASLFYGSACVFLPAALMARGMTSRTGQIHAGLAAVGFMVWELGKLGLSIAMLALAPKLVPQLSWPALLVGLVVCIKVYWLALLWQRKPQD